MSTENSILQLMNTAYHSGCQQTCIYIISECHMKMSYKNYHNLSNKNWDNDESSNVTLVYYNKTNRWVLSDGLTVHGTIKWFQFQKIWIAKHLIRQSLPIEVVKYKNFWIINDSWCCLNLPYLMGPEVAGSLTPISFSAETRNSYSVLGNTPSTLYVVSVILLPALTVCDAKINRKNTNFNH